MRKLFLLSLLVSFLLTACEKDFIRETEQVESARLSAIDRYLLNVAEEGIAMLGEAPTRSGRRRVVDTSLISPMVRANSRAVGGGDTLFYVVNFADSAGFALIDADTLSVMPLIAVTEAGNYTPGEITNTGFDLYAELLSLKPNPGDTIINGDPLPDLIVRTEIEDYYTDWESKGPFVAVKWGQGEHPYNSVYPYNLYCVNNDGDVCPAGCVAIALAQIFSYHRYPVTFKKTFDGGEYTYLMQWPTAVSHIGAPLGGGCTSTCWDHQYMQTLIREIGEQVFMDYQPDESGAYDHDIHRALTHFYYDYTGLRAYSYQLAKADLDLNQPLYMSGRRNGGGHAWVVDGYKQRTHVYRVTYHYYDGSSEIVTNKNTFYGYLHINWGWDGMNNGYFAKDVFDATNASEYDSPNYNWMDYQYTMNLTLMTGISPRF